MFLFVYTNCTNLNLNNNTQPLSSHVLQTRVLRWRKMLSKQNLNNNIGVFTLLNLGRSVTLGKSALAPVSSLRARHCSVNLTGQVQHVPVRWCIHLKIFFFFLPTQMRSWSLSIKRLINASIHKAMRGETDFVLATAKVGNSCCAKAVWVKLQ